MSSLAPAQVEEMVSLTTRESATTLYSSTIAGSERPPWFRIYAVCAGNIAEWLDSFDGFSLLDLDHFSPSKGSKFTFGSNAPLSEANLRLTLSYTEWPRVGLNQLTWVTLGNANHTPG